ncbi:hypothetical protein ACHAW5_001707 [Stephanodiscus triporus]|uniref:Uncharacterized protein n=1 Tax=Stephanodiscus triporus TaxID=2934178 RepID=A0ABD3MYG3_9STRA
MNRLRASLLRSSPRVVVVANFVIADVSASGLPTHRRTVVDGESVVLSVARSSYRSSSSSSSSSSSGVVIGRTGTSTNAAAIATGGLASLHTPVMRDAVLRLWLPDNGRRHRWLIDGTMGLGGHTSSILTAAGAGKEEDDVVDVRVLGIDRDGSALKKARRRLEIESSSSLSRVAFHRGSFADVSPELLKRHSFPSVVDGVLIDLGMNSDQIDDDERGFTFRKRGPLDMRFDASSSYSSPRHYSRDDNDSTTTTTTRRAIEAGDIVNGWSASQLSSIFEKYADEPYAVEIAAGIVRWRESLPRGKGEIRSTLELRYVIEDVVEGIVASTIVGAASMDDDDDDNVMRKKRGNDNDFERYRSIWRPPSTPGRMLLPSKRKTDKLLFKYEERRPRHPNHVMRCFQALRIAVNDELWHIESFFESMLAPRCCLDIGGRLVAIAFHPGEDRLVRQGMARMVDTGRFELLTPVDDGLRPTPEEVKSNGRSRTARLRAVERIR